MKILVIGTGSIGKRHIINLLKLGCSVGAYSYRNEKDKSLVSMGVSFEKDINLAIKNPTYDAVVIANKSHQHIQVAKIAAENKKHIFIEKPLSNNMKGIENLNKLCKKNKLMVETGYMMRLHPNILAIKKFLDLKKIGKIFSISLSVGQWLPDWRPNIDYKNNYSAKKNEGGGVVFDLSHEIDLFRFLIDEASEVFAMTSKIPLLDIETEAIAEILIRSKKNIIGRINLNYIQPSYKREIEIIGSKGSIFWDYNLCNVSFLNKKNKSTKIIHSTKKPFDKNEMYLNYMRFFIKNLSTTKKVSDLENGIKSLKLAIAIHKSASLQRLIYLKE